jgi:protein gp37
MGENSKIQWTDHTFNPWVGCTKVSAGCAHCYAERDFDQRRHFAKWGQAGTRVLTSDANWRKPLDWNRKCQVAEQFNDVREFNLGPRIVRVRDRHRVFCASLCDVFENWPDGLINTNGCSLWWCPYCKHTAEGAAPIHQKRPFACPNCSSDYSSPMVRPFTMMQARLRLWRLIESCPNLDWLLLTKRPENVHVFVPAAWLEPDRWPTNVWIGTSVENQAAADARVPHLLRIPAAVRFLSCEPLLGPVDLSGYHDSCDHFGGDCIYGREGETEIDWVIAGGESGPNARPCHPDWVRGLRDQCAGAGIPFFFKQWGEWLPPDQDGAIVRGDQLLNATRNFMRVGKAKAGRKLDDREWSEFPGNI